MTIRNRIRAVAAALVMTASMGMASTADAGIIQLGFILDGSGSIGAGNWNIIRAGLSNAIAANIPFNDPNSTYEVSIVQFGSIGRIEVQNFLVDSAASRTSLATTVAGLAFLNSGATNFAAAFSTMQSALFGTNTTGRTYTANYVNFATDGQQNQGGTGVTERNNLITAGVDNISIEGIGGGVDATDLQNNFCYPGPCDTTAPFNFPAQGFYIGVADANGYSAAIGNKIATVTGVPEPMTLTLLGGGLLGLALRRRKAS